jgi:hypothetical protein
VGGWRKTQYLPHTIHPVLRKRKEKNALPSTLLYGSHPMHCLQYFVISVWGLSVHPPTPPPRLSLPPSPPHKKNKEAT